MLNPNPQNGSLERYTATQADFSQAGTWFPGTPCYVEVTDSGCYLAWSNGTHYFEEGNYDLDGLMYLPGCPDCSRDMPSMDGGCAADGSLSCSGGRVNYRCNATRVALPDECPAPPRERCCTRVMSGQHSTLRIVLPDTAAISSIAVWSAGPAGGPPLAEPGADLTGLAVSIGSGGTVTGCDLSGPLAAPADGGSMAGYRALPVACGAAGNEVWVQLKGLVGAGRPVAVRLCTVAPGDSLADGAHVWIKVNLSPGSPFLSRNASFLT